MQMAGGSILYTKSKLSALQRPLKLLGSWREIVSKVWLRGRFAQVLCRQKIMFVSPQYILANSSQSIAKFRGIILDEIIVQMKNDFCILFAQTDF